MHDDAINMLEQIEHSLESAVTDYLNELMPIRQSRLFDRTERQPHSEAETGALFPKLRRDKRVAYHCRLEWRTNRGSVKRISPKFSTYIPAGKNGYTKAQLERRADSWEVELIDKYFNRLKTLDCLYQRQREVVLLIERLGNIDDKEICHARHQAKA